MRIEPTGRGSDAAGSAALSAADPERTGFRAVSRASPVPLYHQVKTDLRARIQRGDWRPGDQIASEAELCERYGASRITIRRALGDLVSEGVLVRVSGRGTFVREPTLTAGSRGLTSFTEEMAGLGLRAGARVVGVELREASGEVAEQLGLDEDERVVVVTRIRTGDGKPIGVQAAHLPARLFPGLEGADLRDVSLYEYLERRYGFVPAEAEETFEVGPIRKHDAALLDVREGACAFFVRRRTFDASGRPAEFVITAMRGDRYRVRLGLR
ncbi:MAG: GntR family transcriptional regulator [Streptosporangiaceae bacterium]